ncbi:glycosyltransferase family 4 protein [Acidobacteriota bacterium]
MNQKTIEGNEGRKIFLYGQVPPPQHGSNIMTLTLFKALTKLGYHVRVSNKGFSKKIHEVNRISPVKFFRFFSVLWRYCLDLVSFRPDLVVFFVSATKIGLLVEGLFVTFTNILRIPYVLYIHNNGHKKIYGQGRLGHWIVGRVFFRAKACIVLGKMFQKDIGSFYKKKIFILPNGLLTALPEKGKKSDPNINVLYLANLYESKGIFTLIRAIPQVLEKKQNVKFLIAGPWQDERVRTNVIDYVERNKISANVEFLGAIFGQQKQELFLKSDLFVFPSHYPLETFGLVNLEAMQAGIPVISTDIGAIPEIVLNGQTGFIIPPRNSNILAEKINVLLDDPQLRKTMGSEGKRIFNEKYSFDAYSSHVQGILNNLF